MDEPRLSTIQALLLLLKARELMPRRGYYYRSWQMVKTIVTMAKDLELDEHYALHKDAKLCDLDPVECLVQTRIWQTCLVVEVMVGGPQGGFLNPPSLLSGICPPVYPRDGHVLTYTSV
jgi:hypothetical protein